MVIHKGYKFRIYPTPEQEARLVAWEHTLRWLWNIANEQRLHCLERSEREHRYLTAFDQIYELKELRSDLPWLADVPFAVAGYVLRQLDFAWQRYFKKLSDQPMWKKRGQHVPICSQAPKFKIESEYIKFTRLGSVHAVIHREIEGTPKGRL